MRRIGVRPARWIVGSLVVLLACCTGSDEAPNGAGSGGGEGAGVASLPQLPTATVDDVTPVESTDVSTMSLTLSGLPAWQGTRRSPDRSEIEAEVLSGGAVDELLSRLRPIERRADDESDFAKPEDSPPAPRTGTSSSESFPADSEPRESPDASEGALAVERIQPRGEVETVPHVSVTFNQPMVEVTSHAESTADGVPVELEPQPEGDWRWLGTRTVVFEPDGNRMPRATSYEIRVPQGVESTTGSTLQESVARSFETPPLRLRTIWPSGPSSRLKPTIFVQFNQSVDRQAILEYLELEVPGSSKEWELERVARDEAGERRPVRRRIEEAGDSEWIVVRPTRELPYDSSIEVHLREGAPSAEGPERSKSKQRAGFETHGPFRVEEVRCGYRECEPRHPIVVQFSNRYEPDSLEADDLKVEPPIEGMTVRESSRSSWLTIRGRKKGRETYEVTLPEAMTDRFGQQLEGDRTVEVDVGPARASLAPTGEAMTVLDPASRPQIEVHTVNYASLRVRAYRVEPSDWGEFLEFRAGAYRYRRGDADPPGRRVIHRVVSVDGPVEERVETTIDLKEALGPDGLGNVVVDVEPLRPMRGARESRYERPVRTWVQSTRIGLDAYVDSRELVGWATDLTTGRPLEDVELSMAVDDGTVSTGSSGLGRIDLPAPGEDTDRLNYLRAEREGTVAFLPEREWPGARRVPFGDERSKTSWLATGTRREVRWHVFDDRGVYRPGEAVRLKGWLREVSDSELGGLGLAEEIERVTWRAVGPRGNELADGTAAISSLGGFDIRFELPDDVNLGIVRLRLKARGGEFDDRKGRHRFEVREFRRPEFEVDVTSPEGPFYAGLATTLGLSASYFSGGPLSKAEIDWRVSAKPGSYTPPNHSEFRFGSRRSQWSAASLGGLFAHRRRSAGGSEGTTVEKYAGRTDTSGRHRLSVGFGEIEPPSPMTVTAEASVTDVDDQQITGSTSMVVHPSAFYVGLRADRRFVRRGESLEVDAVVTDVDGERRPGRPVVIRAARVVRTWKQGEYRERFVDPQTCEIESADDPVACSFETDVGGEYSIRATTVDDRGRHNFTEITRWVSGGERAPSRNVEREKVTLVPDHDEYQPGETAEILVRSPIVPAEAMLVLGRNGIVEKRRFRMEEPTTTVEVEIEEGYVPNLWVRVDVLGSRAREGDDGGSESSLPDRPAFGAGRVKLEIPPRRRELDVEIDSERREVAPGASATIGVGVRDADGSPVEGAEVAILAVDEAILSLTDYSVADPLESFYATKSIGLRDHHLRSDVQLADRDAIRPPSGSGGDAPVREYREGTGGGGEGFGALGALTDELEEEADFAAAELQAKGKMAGPSPDRAVANQTLTAARSRSVGYGARARPTRIDVREDFAPLALFEPEERTGSNGETEVEVELPDNLTRYRLIAVAVDGADRFGSGEETMTVRKPLMVQPSPPRFLNLGDRARLPVVVRNQTDREQSIRVAGRATNLSFADGAGYRVRVPANGRAEVEFGVETDRPGRARMQFAATGEQGSDAAEVSLPVWTPATAESFATYGTIDGGTHELEVEAPADVRGEYGGLEVTTSSTALQALTDAFLYLHDYDYRCSEQLASRMLSVAALREVMSAFDAEKMPDDEELAETMHGDIEALAGRQNRDGGFGLWTARDSSWPFASLHAIHALVRVDEEYEVDDSTMTRAKTYLRRIRAHIPDDYPLWTRRFLVSYALYLRDLAGEPVTGSARGIVRRTDNLEHLPFEAVGWLLKILASDGASGGAAARLRRFLNNRVQETASKAHFAARYDENDDGYLIMQSDRRADAIILDALMEARPNSKLIPKIVRGLLAHREKGRWSNTQENGWVLLALERYFQEYEKQTPDFVARVWLGERYAGEHEFRGRTTERHRIEVSMEQLADETGESGEPSKLYLDKEGKGRMYYRVGLEYAPEDLELDPADHGFVVERTYESVGDDSEVRRREDGTWVVEAGAKVRVRLRMVAPTRRYHVALVDSLPAGLEPLNPALATTGTLPEDPKSDDERNPFWWWDRPWYEHQNMRDERVEAFASLVRGGVHTYTYYARATTPGEFVVPPAKAEEMYHPETFGRSGTARLVVR